MELNSNLKWKLYDSKKANTTITIPQSIYDSSNEFLIGIYWGGYSASNIVVKDFFSTLWCFGHYGFYAYVRGSKNNNGDGLIVVDSIKHITGTPTLADSDIWVYYR